MDLKDEFRGLLKKGYFAINELNKSADMVPKQAILKRNGLISQNQAKGLIKNLHQLVNAFDTHLQTFLSRTVNEKLEILESHSDEIIQCVDYMSNLCMMAENLIKESNLQVVSSFGPELKAELLKSLKECRELKLVDYETFTSLDLEVDLSGIFQNPLVNIVSWNPRCLEKQVVHSLGFGSLENDMILSLNQTIPREKCVESDSECETSSQLCSVLKSGHKNGGINPQTKRMHGSTGKLTAIPESSCDEVQRSEENHLLNSDIDAISGPSEQKTKAIDSPLSYCGVTNTPYSSCLSTKSTTNNSSSDLGNSAEQVQSLSYRSGSSNDQALTVSESTLPMISSKKNVETSKKSTPVFEVMKTEMSEDEEMQKIESALKLNLLLSNNNPATEEQNPDDFNPRNLKPDKVEQESFTAEESTSCENILSSTDCPDETTQPPVSENEIVIKSETVVEETSHDEIDFWNSLSVEPLKMTFDLRTVLHENSFRIPEIWGEHIKTITGGTSTKFDHPTGITVTADGLIVVADTGNDMVKVMNNNMLVLAIGNNQDGVNFVRPSAVVTDSEGNIYVKDDFCIQMFDSWGKLLQTIGKSCFHRPYGLALTKHNNEPLLVTIDSGRRSSSVYNYFIKEDKLLSYPYGPTEEYSYPTSKVRFLGAHNDIMLVSDLGASTMYLSLLDGQTLKAFGWYGDCVGEFKEPSGITVDAVGNWIVGDSKNNRLQVFTNDGQVLAMMKLSSPIRRPSGIHLTSDGQLYVINYLESVIKVYELHQ